MSKATIQMCMTTTGFGPQALRAISQTHGSMRPSHSPSTTYTPTSEVDAKSDLEMSGYQQTGYFPQNRRPAPRFDMNLKDLFSEDETDKRSFSRISNHINSMRPPPPPQQIKQEPQQQMQAFSTDLKISPQIRYQQTPQQQQQTSYPFQPLPSPSYPSTNTAPALSPPISQAQVPQTLTSPYQPISNQMPYNAFAQNVTSTYPDLGFSDLDFLDSFPVQGTNGNGGSINNGGETATAGGLQDLGFGMGFGINDGTHDWSDGNGFDLFDGFFFGPGGTGGV
ncbi:hypothetical protein P280DRAFT_273256 [Massarina eburnea CBS 473.64]|uniref:Uncharacterized protein n=1 Tax=Massarina eburnea CBS 473.64 TaxID=1395130 RepID=A0A6A6S540_9PLEO|nr:hypothetical protein P280DRAFT_273256 [Massarina eburnea CBS 473.64]